MIRAEGVPWLLDRMKGCGVTALILGSPRSGKTTFMARLAMKIMEMHPDELIFWRGDEHCQWAYLPLEKVRLLLSPLHSYSFVNLESAVDVDVSSLVHSVHVCSSLEDYYASAMHGVVNVFYMPSELYITFFRLLKNRPRLDWCSVFVDEIQELYPENAEGSLWWVNLEVGNIITHFPKRMVNFYCATQSYALVSYQVKHHMRYWVFMQRAKKPSAMNFRVYQTVIDKLKRGQCIVEGAEGFQLVEFPPLPMNANLLCVCKPRVVAQVEVE